MPKGLITKITSCMRIQPGPVSDGSAQYGEVRVSCGNLCVFLLSKVKTLAKQYTGLKNEDQAVVKFREVLKSRDMFFNRDPFPDDESGDEAYMKCAYPVGARAFCPVRWRALQKWINYTKHVSKTFFNSCSRHDNIILRGRSKGGGRV